LLIYTLATGIAVIVYMGLLKSQGMTMKAAGYRGRLTWKGAMAAVIAVVIVSFIVYPLIEMGLRSAGVPMYWTTGQIAPVNQNTLQDMLLGILVTVILAPLTEDTIFRGYVYQAFAQRMHRWVAITVSSLIFALLHIQFFGPGMAIWILVFGTASAWLYSRFDNIYPSLLFHALNNLWAYIILPMIFK
jgi:membrane protease YdiL (CAAX protease family)